VAWWIAGGLLLAALAALVAWAWRATRELRDMF
jgi:hypothetical protein